LPQLFSPVSPSSGSTLGAARVRKPLAPSRELCAAAAVHRKIHMVEMEHKAKVNETLGVMEKKGHHQHLMVFFDIVWKYHEVSPV
jgi:hypothetical protein